ncbi:hypothetical protein EMGBS3_12670 [Anaerolineaceae bacterium]|nr:hypothetical protein EMGBS3_12670 [Anaerolineaceae bacterium]
MSREALIAELQALTSAQRASAAPAHLDQHSQDQSSHAAHQPDAVVWPETTAEVSSIAALANRQAHWHYRMGRRQQPWRAIPFQCTAASLWTSRT